MANTNSLIFKRLAIIEKGVQELLHAFAVDGGLKSGRGITYIDEAEAMTLTGLSKKSLQVLRKKGVLRFATSPTGRNIKYIKVDVINYALKFSDENDK